MDSLASPGSVDDVSSASTTAGEKAGDISLHTLLHKAGVAESRIDPSSLQALRDMFSESSSSKALVQDSSSGGPLATQLACNPLDCKPSQRDFVIPGAATPTERLILEQLRDQTTLLLKMQQQIDQLTQQQFTIRPIEKINPKLDDICRLLAPTSGTNGPRESRPTVQSPPPPTPPERPPAPHGPSFWQRNFIAIRGMRALKIIRLYSQLLRARLNNNRNNPGFDPLMLIKILVMLAILVSRIAPPRKNQHIDGGRLSWNFHFYFIAALVVPLFLHQTGILAFCYQFCFKFKYPARIWSGENITLEQALEQQQRAAIVARVQNAAAVPPPFRRNNHWLAALVMGTPPTPQRQQDDGDAPELQPPPPAPVPLVVRALQDIVVVFGSFFLSIFPMWRAIGPADPLPPRNRPLMPHAQPQLDPEVIPFVLPPADLADMEEDDGDNDGDSDDENDDDDQD